MRIHTAWTTHRQNKESITGKTRPHSSILRALTRTLAKCRLRRKSADKPGKIHGGQWSSESEPLYGMYGVIGLRYNMWLLQEYSRLFTIPILIDPHNWYPHVVTSDERLIAPDPVFSPLVAASSIPSRGVYSKCIDCLLWGPSCSSPYGIWNRLDCCLVLHCPTYRSPWKLGGKKA